MVALVTRHSARVLSALALAAILMAFAGCSPIPEFGEAPVSDVYAVGVDAAAGGDYLVAIEAFKRITDRWPMDDLADDALMGLADSYREIGDYALAEGEYLRLMVDYPRSSLVPEAEYKLGLVYYEESRPSALDQSKTLDAIDQFNRFLSRYPESAHAEDASARIIELRSRLAEKDLAAAELYMTLGNTTAARVYYEAVIAEYPDTPVAPKALLGIVRSNLADDDVDAAREALHRLEAACPECGETREAAQAVAGHVPSGGATAE